MPDLIYNNRTTESSYSLTNPYTNNHNFIVSSNINVSNSNNNGTIEE